MSIEAYLAQVCGRGVETDLSRVEAGSRANAVDRDWRGLLKPSIYSKSVKTGVAGDELDRLISAWPNRETVGTRRGVHPLDMSLGPFWRAGTSVPMAWANVDFDAPCRACVERDEEATCSHKEPPGAAVELAWADAFSFHKWLEHFGLQVSRFVDGRFEAGDYTLVLSGRRGVGILLARLLAPQPYRGLRQLLDDLGGDWPTLDEAALRSKPVPVRVPLSQHPGESDSERAGLRLPLDPELIGPSLSPEDARTLLEHSLALGRAAREGELEAVEHLPKIFADVMLPKVDASEAWDGFVARLEERAPQQSGSSDQPGITYESHGVPEDIKQACCDLGLYRGDGNHSVLVDCPCCGESTAWVTRDGMLWCFRKKCPAAENDGGLSFDSWHRQSHLPAAQILRVFSQCAAHSGATEHAVSALGGLAANGLPLARDHVRPSNEAEQGAVAFFDPWLTAQYWLCQPAGTSNTSLDADESRASKSHADAEGLLSSIGSGHVSLEELPANASSEGVDTQGPTFEYLASDRWRELAHRIAELERPLQQFIGPCASMHQSDEAYRLWKQKVTRANDLRSLDSELSDDGRARPTVDQLGTCTGRFSWSSPPLASISKETRQYLIPAPGRRFVSLDISQAQLRIVAELSGDPALLEVFEAKDDVHSAIAAQLFGEDPDESQRSQAKAVSFGVLLGMGSGTLVDYAVNFGAEVSGAEAVKLIDRFIEKFSGVRWYRQDLFLAMLRRGAVVAPSWRRCKFDPNDDGLHHGTTLAYILQMMEVDIIKTALLRACEELDLDRARPSMVLHDEIMVEAEEDYVEEAAEILERAMSESLVEHFRQCPAGPLEPKVSRCWGEGHSR